MLQGIQYDSSESVNDKLGDFLYLAELWFDMQDSTSAETNVNKAAHMIHKTEDRELQMRYKRASV